jgi:hypothetical protein
VATLANRHGVDFTVLAPSTRTGAGAQSRWLEDPATLGQYLPPIKKTP